MSQNRTRLRARTEINHFFSTTFSSPLQPETTISTTTVKIEIFIKNFCSFFKKKKKVPTKRLDAIGNDDPLLSTSPFDSRAFRPKLNGILFLQNGIIDFTGGRHPRVVERNHEKRKKNLDPPSSFDKREIPETGSARAPGVPTQSCTGGWPGIAGPSQGRCAPTMPRNSRRPNCPSILLASIIVHSARRQVNHPPPPPPPD